MNTPTKLLSLASVLLLLVLCGLVVWLKEPQLGIDLRGGTSLVYQVDLAGDPDPVGTIERVIEVYQKRLDPDGSRNIVFTRQGEDRIEIQVPLAKKEVRELARAYEQQFEQLMSKNLSSAVLDSIVARGDVESLVGGSELRQELLAQLQAAHQKLKAAQNNANEADAQIAEADKLVQQIQQQLNDLGDDASQDQRDQLKQQLEQRRSQLQAIITEMEPRLAEREAAKQTYDTLRRAVLGTNLSAIRLESALGLPIAGLTVELFDKQQQAMVNLSAAETAELDKLRQQIESGVMVSLRDIALTRLKAVYPGRADQISAVADSHLAYDQQKGMLDDPETIKTLMRGSGKLEFRIAPRDGAVANVEQYRLNLQEKGPRGQDINDPYLWVEVAPDSSFAETDFLRQQMLDNPIAYFKAERGMIGGKHGDKAYVLLANSKHNSITDTMPEWQLTKALATSHEGYPAVSFELNTAGGKLMSALHSAHRGEPMAIVLDDQVINAPALSSDAGLISTSGVISGGSGGFSPQQQQYLIRILSAGSLAARVIPDPVQELTTQPKFGADNLHAGQQAAYIAIMLVAVFMVLYYFFWGALADFALGANMLLILAFMFLREEAFTLPGIAGMVLTIGMAVDANVLIFERIREELDRGVDLRTAVRLGYEKAFSTILDANITTLIICVVLYLFAPSVIKGFAVTLALGVLATMFTALFCTHLLADLFLDITRAKKVGMLSTLAPGIHRILTPKINWVGLRYVFMGLSIVLMVFGVGAIWSRGSDLLDIEFRGGTQVIFDLKPDQRLSIRDVDARLQQASQQYKLPALERGQGATIEELGDKVEGRSAAFRISSIETDMELVREAISDVFADVLPQIPAAHFIGDQHERIQTTDVETNAPVYPISKNTLTASAPQLTGRMTEANQPVTDYLGGVMIVVDKLDTPMTVEDVRQRIANKRLDPLYEGLGHRKWEVRPLDEVQLIDNQEVYQAFVVLTTDEYTNYNDVRTQSAFDHPEGLANTEWRIIRDAMIKTSGLTNVSNFSSQVIGRTQNQAIVSMALALLAITLYIWLRFGDPGEGILMFLILLLVSGGGVFAALIAWSFFELPWLGALLAVAPPVFFLLIIVMRYPALRYGPAAIAALVHDVLIAMGLVAVAGWVADSSLGEAMMLDDFKINFAMVAAVMTIIGYSLNDTIVVFDRIRENRGRLSYASPQVINDSINQTISRTVLTSGTTILALMVLYIYGGVGVHGFAFAMMMGVVVGTYSSVAIAAPILLVGGKVGESPAKDDVYSRKPGGGFNPAPAK